jgi:ADP-dependent NAD(P)H-hydrate dehydratase / NAD(P)H-hydrate epimerase
MPGIPENKPELWKHKFIVPQEPGNKYDRGHVVVLGGNEFTGAAKLAALAALRIGAGLVTILAEASSFPIYAASSLSVMVKEIEGMEAFEQCLADTRKNIFVLGPGAGVTEGLKQKILLALHYKKSLVLDADALTVFKNHGEELFKAIHSDVVMTPHEGEFQRLFSITGSRIEQAQHAAKQSGAVMVLKGSRTIIAAPDGRTVENHNAPVWLATAGTGDVLAGMIAGIMATGVAGFDAACMAVWLHGKIGQELGIGMISEDMLERIPKILKEAVGVK